MNRKNASWPRNPLTRLLGLILLAALALPAGAVWSMVASSGRSARLADDLAAAPTPVKYVGKVKLAQVLPGVVANSTPIALPTPQPGVTPPDLGEFDLGLQLTDTSTGVNGNVDLAVTLVFTGTIPVHGQFQGANMAVNSDEVSQVSGGRTVKRQFFLNGTEVSGEPGVYSGQYRETISHYGPQPMTAVGTFVLAREVSTGIVPSNSLYLPLVLRRR